MSKKNQLTVQDKLLAQCKVNRTKLKKLHDKVMDEWCYEDYIYRFYHLSYKAYYAQSLTEEIVVLLRTLAPKGTTLSPLFLEIIRTGTGITFDPLHNRNWCQHVRPIIEAFLHAKYLLEMAIKYGTKYKKCPIMLENGLAALLELYRIR